MDMHLDLHSHSGYAGGVGKTSFEDVERNMPYKGINVVGTGDCLFPSWKDELRRVLREEGHGIFKFNEDSSISYVLQTEIIITAEVGGGRRKGVHTLILFPSFESIDRVSEKIGGWGMKNTVGRPFLKCETPIDVGEKLIELKSIDEYIEIIPAHVLTPEGVFGSKAPVDHLSGFYGEFASDIRIIETGLSADPLILSLIPEFDDISFISNSDAHSPALDRMGREFTTIESKRDYASIIDSLRKNDIVGTAEFNPVEGRYFLTGHRAGRAGHDDSFCAFSPDHTPQGGICPICGKRLTIGVYERALELSRIQGAERHIGEMGYEVPFVHMVPLVEIISYSLGISNTSSKKVIDRYFRITSRINECDLWFEKPESIEKRLEGIVEYSILKNIMAVKDGNFCFNPAGYDGEYGNLVIGKSIDYDNINMVCLSEKGQDRGRPKGHYDASE
ncbi:MAG: hypothetical protein JW825_02595 [Candidatus Methanofastidiosa archaeon]|nr:hypothetical protein [Candidatus Methanofastidiosa archaeon]